MSSARTRTLVAGTLGSVSSVFMVGVSQPKVGVQAGDECSRSAEQREWASCLLGAVSHLISEAWGRGSLSPIPWAPGSGWARTCWLVPGARESHCLPRSGFGFHSSSRPVPGARICEGPGRPLLASWASQQVRQVSAEACPWVCQLFRCPGLQRWILRGLWSQLFTCPRAKYRCPLPWRTRGLLVLG